MKTLEFKISIAADKQKVWNMMLSPETYKEWISVSFPGSHYEGTWKQGETIKFLSPGYGGTLATLVECKPFELVVAKHIAVINADGTEDRSSSVAQTWIGTTETYTFTGSNGNTELRVEMDIYPEWEKMFTESWPKTLDKLKQICEK